MVVLLVYWEKHNDWEQAESRFDIQLGTVVSK